MADVKQIEVNGVTYDIHDAVAREEIASLQQSVSHGRYLADAEVINNTAYAHTFTFDRTFSETPIVVASQDNSNLIISVDNVSMSGFSVYVRNTSGSTRHFYYINWIAIV